MIKLIKLVTFLVYIYLSVKQNAGHWWLPCRPGICTTWFFGLQNVLGLRKLLEVNSADDFLNTHLLTAVPEHSISSWMPESSWCYLINWNGCSSMLCSMHLNRLNVNVCSVMKISIMWQKAVLIGVAKFIPHLFLQIKSKAVLQIPHRRRSHKPNF